MIRYVEPVFRPPSEADSLILQLSVGCSYNRCTFCGMYRSKRFRIRPLGELAQEISWAREHQAPIRKVFLGDGDALIAKADTLRAVLEQLHEAFSDLRRVSIYASPQALRARTVDEMRQLREAGLNLYYLGVESGHDTVLSSLEKGVCGDEMIQLGLKVQEAGVGLSTMILLGAGGRALSIQHARASARVISAIDPRFLSTLVLTPVPGTPLGALAEAGKFPALTPLELAQELREFLVHLDLRRCIFRANHASNYLPLAGTLPRDKPRLIEQLDRILENPTEAAFRPEWMRGL